MVIAVLYDKIMDLAIALGARNLSGHPGCWRCAIGPRWKVAINGHKFPEHCDDVTIEPYEMALWYDGWPAGIISLAGGIVAAGTEANEDALISTIDAEIKRIKDARK